MITNTKLYVPVVTLSTKDNNHLTKQLSEGFKRIIYWNQYVSKPFTEQAANKTRITRFALDAAFQGVNRYLFLLLKILVQMKLLMLLHHEIYLLTE